MAPSPVVGIPNNGMVDMLHMPAQLMLAAGFWIQLHQTIATGGIAFDFHGDFRGRQAAVSGTGIAHWLGFGFAPSVLRLFSQWMINIPLLWCPTPNHGQIGFAYLASHHRLPQSARSFRVAGEYQYPRRWSIQPVHRIYMLAAVRLPAVPPRALGSMLAAW